MGEQAEIVTGNTYDKYGTSNPLARRLMRGFMDRLEEAVAAAGLPTSVAEVGCGEGHVTERVQTLLPSAQLQALDIDPELAKTTQRRCPGVTCLTGDAQSLPWPDEAFDLVMAIEVLEHVPEPALAVDELARVTRQYVIASVPNEPVWRVMNIMRGSYLKQLGNTPGHVQHWGAGGFKQLLQERFNILRFSKPLPWLMALCEKK